MSNGHEEFLKEHLCSHCHAAIMYEHPELRSWVKCVLCGFSIEIKKPIKDIHKITGNPSGS